MDDVLADATGQFIMYYEKEFGVKVNRSVLDGKDEGEGFPDSSKFREFAFRTDFFRTMKVNDNSQQVMEELNKKYELFIVSAAIEFPQSLPEKLEWLKEHFSFLNWKQIVFCGSKAVVHGDYMIDDLPHNLERFNGEKFIFTAPHNTHYHQFQRLNNWDEVGKRLL
jgi:5'(3')-deoxyribonucleotidase